MLPALGTALCLRGMVEALQRHDTRPLLLSCIVLGCCQHKVADWIDQACSTVGAERGDAAAAPCPGPAHATRCQPQL